MTKRAANKKVLKSGAELEQPLPSLLSFVVGKSPVEKAIILGNLHCEIHNLIGKLAYDMVGATNNTNCLNDIARLTKLSKTKIEKARWFYGEKVRNKVVPEHRSDLKLA